MVAETETVGTTWLCQDIHVHIATKFIPGLIASPMSRDRNDLCHIAWHDNPFECRPVQDGLGDHIIHEGQARFNSRLVYKYIRTGDSVNIVMSMWIYYGRCHRTYECVIWRILCCTWCNVSRDVMYVTSHDIYGVARDASHDMMYLTWCHMMWVELSQGVVCSKHACYTVCCSAFLRVPSHCLSPLIPFLTGWMICAQSTMTSRRAAESWRPSWRHSWNRRRVSTKTSSPECRD